MTLAAVASLAARVDDVTREGARRAAERELADPRYHHREPLVIRIVTWALRRLGELLDSAAQRAPGGGWGLLGIVALTVALVLIARARMGGLGTSAAQRAVFAPSRPETAAEHRATADAAAQAQHWAVAIVERFRAVARELEEQGLLEPRPGRTAAEVGRDAAAEPALGSAVQAAAAVFDEVQYGGRPGTADGHEVVWAADRLLTTQGVQA